MLDGRERTQKQKIVSQSRVKFDNWLIERVGQST